MGSRKWSRTLPRLRPWFRAGLVAVALVLTTLVAAGVLAQGDYSLEYGIESVDSAVSQTTDYQVVDLVVSQGAEGGVLNSSVYRIVPVLAPEIPPVSEVSLWMLF